MFFLLQLHVQLLCCLHAELLRTIWKMPSKFLLFVFILSKLRRWNTYAERYGVCVSLFSFCILLGGRKSCGLLHGFCEIISPVCREEDV